MSLLREWFGPSREEIWRQVSDQIGGKYVEGGFWKGDRVEASHRGWKMTLDVHTVSTGKSLIQDTRLRAPFVNPDGFRFSIGRKSLLHVLGILGGAQDIQVGVRDFDDAFAIKGNNEAKVRELFSSARLRELFAAQPAVRFSVKDDDGIFGPTFPEGVDQLELLASGVVKDVSKLQALFELFATALDELCRIGSAYENGPPGKS